MASQLKRDLLAMQAGKNAQIAPYARASKASAKVSTTTSSKSNNHPKAGGTSKIGTKFKTGAAASPVNVPKAKVKSKGVKYFKPTPTGKATPNVKIPGAKPMRIQGVIS